MYQSNAFSNFVKVQAKTFGSQYQSYAEEFEDYDDEELLKRIDNNAGQMRHYELTDDSFDVYFGELQRMVECLKMRQEFQQEMAEDEL